MISNTSSLYNNTTFGENLDIQNAHNIKKKKKDKDSIESIMDLRQQS
jgi:hypothetical protein